MLPNTLSFVDIETTGGSPTYSRIIEIGIVKVKDGKVVSQYNQLINPQQHLDPFITQLTGITSKDLDSAPTFSEIKKDILELLVDSLFIAHNVRFDYGFLRQEFKREEISFSLKHLCTVKLARLLYPSLGSYNLDSIISNFNLTCENRHRAFDDAKAIWDFYSIAQKDRGEDIFKTAVNTALKRPAVPLSVSEDILNSLPDTPGVYVFYGKENQILYIGKSINIRDRVLSHFSNDYLSATDMELSQEVKHIEAIPTSGELGALLLESNMIKKEQPLFNKRLRYARQMTILTKTVNDDGYNTVSTQTVGEISVETSENVLGVFRSRKQLSDFLYKAAIDSGLCPKLLGLEKAKKACFSSQLGKCKGACVSKELPIMYNIRFENAFYKQKIRPWRFSGPIVIKEESEGFVVDKWCLLGKIDADSSIDSITNNYSFDLDTYKILSRYILNKSNKGKISTLPNTFTAQPVLS